GGTTDVVVDRDGPGDPERVLFESRHAVLQVGDGGGLLGVGSLEGSDAVAEGHLVTTEQDDELADVGDVRTVALDGSVDASEVGRSAFDGTGAALEAEDVALHQLQDAVDVGDVFGVLTSQGVGLVREAVGGVRLSLSGVDGDALRSDLVLQVAEDRRIGATGSDGGFELVETGRGGRSVVGEASDGALGGGEADTLRGDVGGELLNGVAQR